MVKFWLNSGTESIFRLHDLKNLKNSTILEMVGYIKTVMEEAFKSFSEVKVVTLQGKNILNLPMTQEKVFHSSFRVLNNTVCV